ncbi:MAG: DEAD/DEAH box helicase [Bacteroidia bacterium]|nr:DEAD/DEAH box helicase [Bacteroidia bacterium]
MITFEEMGLQPGLLRSLKELGFEEPMPVQEQVIPAILGSTRDIIALAQTGTGKTAAFGLPLIQNTDINEKIPQTLILCPTRELCMQVAGDLRNYARYTPGFSVVSVYGGTSIDQQINDLKTGAHIIVATPGRMNDIIRRKKVNLNAIRSLVLDEADEMLNMGFQEELNAILEWIPKKRRAFLFSATMPAGVAHIAANYLNNAQEISIGTKNAGADNVRHFSYMVKASDRYLALKRIVDYYPEIYGIIFCRTREETKDVAEKLMKDGYNADALHGDLSQPQRDNVMKRFRTRFLQILVATDVAARGLDVDDLSHVINYNLPDDPDIYTHRSGRTGRAGKSGISISLIQSRDKGQISIIEKNLRKKIEPRQIPGGREICEKQLFRLIDNMENVKVNESEIDDFLPVIYKKLHEMSREDIIKRFVSTEFNRFLDYYRFAPDLNISVFDHGKKRTGPGRDGNREGGKTNWIKIRINVGERDNVTTAKLLRLISDNTRKKKIRIGKVSIRRSDSFFDIEDNNLDLITRSFKSSRLDGRDVSVSVYQK